jgi:hypothetical protein
MELFSKSLVFLLCNPMLSSMKSTNKRNVSSSFIQRCTRIPHSRNKLAFDLPFLTLSKIFTLSMHIILSSKIHKLINSIWNKEKLPDQRKESIIVPVHKMGDKTDCSNYHRI